MENNMSMNRKERENRAKALLNHNGKTSSQIFLDNLKIIAACQATILRDGGFGDSENWGTAEDISTYCKANVNTLKMSLCIAVDLIDDLESKNFVLIPLRQ